MVYEKLFYPPYTTKVQWEELRFIHCNARGMPTSSSKWTARLVIPFHWLSRFPAFGFVNHPRYATLCDPVNPNRTINQPSFRGSIRFYHSNTAMFGQNPQVSSLLDNFWTHIYIYIHTHIISNTFSMEPQKLDLTWFWWHNRWVAVFWVDFLPLIYHGFQMFAVCPTA